MAIKKKSPNEYWEEGKALADSIFEFGSTEIIEKYDAINDLPNSGVPDFSSPEQIEKYPAGILGTFSAIVDVIKISETKISTRNALRQQLIDEIYRDIKSGELIGIGFRSPRYTYRQPVIIPKDVFDSRINGGVKVYH